MRKGEEHAVFSGYEKHVSYVRQDMVARCMYRQTE